MGVARWWTWLLLLPVLLLPTSATALDVDVTWSLVRQPTVATTAATDVSRNTAVLRGFLADFGGSDSVAVSFEWGVTPALGQETQATILAEPGNFSAFLSDLEAAREYYFRAKAVGNGTAYGETLSFKTSPGPLVEDSLPQSWAYAILAAAVAVMAFFILRKRPAAQATKERLIKKAFFINNKGQLLKEVALGSDGVELGYRELLKLLVGKGLIKVETVKAGKYYVHFLHRDGIHVACVSLSRSREKVLERATRLFEEIKDDLPT